MAVLFPLSLRLVLLAFLVQHTFSFTLQKQPVNLVQKAARIQHVSHNLFISPESKRNGVFMTAEGQEEAESIEVVSDDDDDDGSDEKRSITKTVLLTVPLFCKFVVVLLIKFVTDLIVFPLLFLYRLAGTAKRSILKKLGSFKKIDKVNGEH